MLIEMGVPPIPLATLMMDWESQKNIYLYDIKVTERRTTAIDRKTNPCKLYNDQNGLSFNQCVKDFIGGYFKEHMKCFLPGIHKIVDHSLDSSETGNIMAYSEQGSVASPCMEDK